MNRTLLIAVVLMFELITSGTFAQKASPLKVALSMASQNYIDWVHRADATVETIDMKSLPVNQAVKLLVTCNGLILTGGEDVYPTFYGKADEAYRCTTNPARDTLEFALIEKALELKIPIIGICRGQQILNVSQGGNLIVDIPEDYSKKIVHKQEDYLNCYHNINTVKGSLLKQISKSDSGMVTSNHHQAVKTLAAPFKAAAYANDSIIESFQWVKPKGKSFLIAVQWHPERMDSLSPLSMPIVRRFIREAYRYKRRDKAVSNQE
ncbi:MAG: gamma-glutamyl-gamma-aminobutyrate hydrolase family protein [Bacteroidota bacterium]|nr:gamma-glutamyl-gamma-aminobutyrate hydrolase family protein [Bacteroidota bacterium]